MRNLIATLCLTLAVLSGCAEVRVPADYEKGLDAWQRGDYATALQEWSPLAKQGDVRSQFNLGLMYAKGHGVLQNFKEAAKWYRLSAEQGDARAQYNLGVMHIKGHSVPQDDSEAEKWTRLAAKQGHIRAQHNLGVMYEKGRGVPKDFKEAVKWYHLAAEQSHIGAQYKLGLKYQRGRQGISRNYKEAAKWYQLAAEQGDTRAQNNLGWMYMMGRGVKRDKVYAYIWGNIAASKGHPKARKLRDIVVKRMTPAQIAEAQKRARDCIRKKYKGC